MQKPVHITRVMIIDDHPLIRDSLARVLGQCLDFEVVASLEKADDASAVVQRQQADLVICDLIMPGMDSFQAMRMVKKIDPRVKIVIFSAYAQDKQIDQALSVGVQGFIKKSENQQSLVEGLRRVVSGHTYFSPELRERVLTFESRSRGSAVPTRLSQLTKRELEILSYVARGMPNGEIALVSHITPKTVENHCTSIMRKLDIHYRVELALYGAREGLGAAEEMGLPES